MVKRFQATVTASTASTFSLELEDGQMLSVPVEAGQPEVGESYVVTVMPDTEAKLERDELARTLLNQLIGDVPTT